MPKKTAMTEQEAHERLRQIDRRLEDIEEERGDLDREEEDLEAEVKEIEDLYPPPRELPRVQRYQVAGVTWTTDGFQALRGEWPDEHQDWNPANPEALATMLPAYTDTQPIVTVAGYGEIPDWDEGGAMMGTTLLSDGSWLITPRLERALQGRGLVMRHTSGMAPVSFWDGADLVGILAPISGADVRPVTP